MSCVHFLSDAPEETVIPNDVNGKKVLEQGGQANAALTEKTPIPAVSQVYSNCYAPG